MRYNTPSSHLNCTLYVLMYHFISLSIFICNPKINHFLHFSCLTCLPFLPLIHAYSLTDSLSASNNVLTVYIATGGDAGQWVSAGHRVKCTEGAHQASQYSEECCPHYHWREQAGKVSESQEREGRGDKGLH